MRKPSFVRRLRKVLLAANVSAMLVGAASVGLFLGGISSVRGMLPDTTALSDYRPHASTLIYSTEPQKDGTVQHTLLGKVFEEDRTPVPLKDIPEPLRQATVAIEDRRFYEHQGIDPRGIARAVWVNLKGGGYVQGASTITQQLARTIWLTREKSIDRKMKEMVLALEMERKFSKDEILEMYLNEVNYGHGAYGVASAAKLYFDVGPRELDTLTLAQCALLAGLPQRPADYSPFDHPDRARRRRDTVLDAMTREGHITSAQARQAKAAEIGEQLSERRARGMFSWRAPYFASYVVDVLSDDDNLGSDVVRRGGLRVYTSLDMRLQKAAEEALEAGVKRLARQRVDTGALVCIEVKTGRVLAMVGGVGPFREHQWNGAAQAKRQPGSAFKPYVYAAALQRGWGPRDGVSGATVTVSEGAGRYHTFHNYTGGQGHMWSLSSALAHSVNCAAVRLQQQVGSAAVVETTATLMDIPDGRLHHFASLALGTADVSPLEMATGFSAFANAGRRAKRMCVDEIRDSRGETLIRNDPTWERVVRRDTAISMVSMLEGVVRGGTGTRARLTGSRCAGKTGTTQRFRDAWFVGFTPDLCTAVWVGRVDNGPTARIYGGSAAAPIWRQFMQKAVETLELKDRKWPSGEGVTGGQRRVGPQAEKEDEEKTTITVTVCTASGKLATEYCPATRRASFEEGGGPTDDCPMHRGPAASGPAPGGPGPVVGGTVTVTVCAESGQRAGQFCPSTVQREFPAGGAPGRTCAIHGPRTTPPGGGQPPEPPAVPPGSGDAGGGVKPPPSGGSVPSGSGASSGEPLPRPPA